MEKFELNTEIPTSLSEIETIQESSDQMIRNREQLTNLIEIPLLSACQELYDKNIQTLATSANKKDIGTGEIYIIIDFNSLSPENQEIAKQYADVVDLNEHASKWGKLEAVKIIIPVNPIDEKISVLEIKQEAEKIADAFKEQPMTWAPKYTLEDLKECYCIDSDDLEIWEDELGFYYDREEKVFYVSEEHYKKTKDVEDINE